MKSLDIISNILLIISIGATIGLSVIYIIILPNSLPKYLILFYLLGLCFLLILMLASSIIEIHNKNNNENKKTFSYFKDDTWQSYIYHTIIIIPLVAMIVMVIGLNITHKDLKPEIILQIIYWVIAIANFIWFCWHLIKANTPSKIQKINLMLKLAVCIVSGVGLLMDFVAKVNFTKQFIVMAWTILFMSYIVDKKNVK